MIYKFPNFEFNTINKQLLINGQSIAVDERIVNLLSELIAHYPQHCKKSWLTEQIWPDTIVSNWSISKLVSEARLLFKQHGIEQEIIQTLHGRGYRLASDFGEQVLTDSADSHTTNRHLPKTANSSLLRSKKWLPIFALAILAGVAIYYLTMPSKTLIKSEPKHSIGRLLWVDDNPQNNHVEKTYLEKHNITVYQVTSSEEALTSLSLYQYDAIISDMGRGGEVLAGLNLLKALRERNDRTPFIMYTIVLTQAQQSFLTQYQGQGVAVESEKLYQLVLPYFKKEDNKQVPP